MGSNISPARRADFDLGLEVLMVITPTGMRWSQSAIARATGQTQASIYWYERQALKKLRERLTRAALES